MEVEDEDSFMRLTNRDYQVSSEGKFYIFIDFLTAVDFHPISFSYFSINDPNRCKRLDYFLPPSPSSTSYYEIERRKWSLSDDRLDFYGPTHVFAEIRSLTTRLPCERGEKDHQTPDVKTHNSVWGENRKREKYVAGCQIIPKTAKNFVAKNTEQIYAAF